jgi:glyoxylase-like metal-dependent hydrolase (beta-lactamase superfamily II)
MIPSSTLQYEAATTGTIPFPARVCDSVWEIPQRIPGGTLAYSLSYVFSDDRGGLHVVDPGWDSDENWAALNSALTSFGASMANVATIVATHLHPDHLGMAQRLRAATGAKLVMHEVEHEVVADYARLDPPAGVLARRLDAWGVPSSRRCEISLPSLEAGEHPIPTPDLVVRDGDLLEMDGSTLRVLHTPGHTTGHICLIEETRSLVLTGDLILPTTYAGLGLGGESATSPLVDYLDSLDRVAVYDDYQVLPGHGYRFTGLAQRCRQSKEHHLRRSREVAAVLSRSADSSVWDIASQLTWGGGWETLRGFRRYSALAQTAMHRHFVQAAIFSGSRCTNTDPQTPPLSGSE